MISGLSLYSSISRKTLISFLQSGLAVLAMLLVSACQAPMLRDSAEISPPGQYPEKPVPKPGKPLQREQVSNILAAEMAIKNGQNHEAAMYYAAAVENTDDTALLKHAIRVAGFAGEWGLAEKLMDDYWQLGRVRPEDYQMRLMIVQKTGDREKILATCQNWLDLEQENEMDIWHQLSSTLALDEEGATIAGELAERYEGHERAMILLMQSRILAHWKKMDEASEILDKVRRIAPGEAETWIWSARMHEQSGNREARVEDLMKALAIRPESRQLRFTTATALNSQGRTSDALDVLKKLGRDPMALHASALFSYMTGNSRDAHRYYRKMQDSPTIHSEDKSWYLGQTAQMLGLTAEAIEWFARINSGKRVADATLKRARLLALSGKSEEALEILSSLDADNLDLFRDVSMLQADIYSQGRQDEKALSVLARALRESPDDRDMLYRYGLLAARLNYIDEAISTLEFLLGKDPDNPAVLNALGYTIADSTDHYDEALVYIKRALELAPDDPAVIDSMGWVMYRMNRLDEAEMYLRRAFALKEDAEIAAHLGEVLWVRGLQEEAREIWQRGMRLAPDNTVLVETLKRYETP